MLQHPATFSQQELSTVRSSSQMSRETAKSVKLTIGISTVQLLELPLAAALPVSIQSAHQTH